MLDRDIEILKTILNHTKRIKEKIRGVSNKELEEDLDLQEVLSFNILQIGELTNKLSDEFKNRNKNIPWKDINGMRNIIVHGYSFVDVETVYDTSVHDIPELEKEIKIILKKNN